MPGYTAIGAIIGSEWATDEALEAQRTALLEAGAVDPVVERGEHLVDLRFRLEAEDEDDAKDVAHRVLTAAATTHGWMVTEFVADSE